MMNPGPRSSPASKRVTASRTPGTASAAAVSTRDTRPRPILARASVA